ncbi:MAG: NAD(P)H-dependent oxidoreductase [Hyphomonadaceae bacterium]|nr:NAD(P)H-dependent oxidoreductase [Hyphomonadaceae bacterium]
MSRKIAVLVGSLRKGSLNRKVAEAVALAAPGGLEFSFVEIGDLPFFDQDLEGAPPAQWVRFRDQIRAADAVLFVTPEYNRSVPGVLKNAIDVGSRPYGQSVFNGKPAAVISASMGAIGGFGANHHLRQSLAFLNMPTLPSPETYIGVAHELFDEAGALKNEQTRAFLTQFAGAFAGWTETQLGKSEARIAA